MHTLHTHALTTHTPHTHTLTTHRHYTHTPHHTHILMTHTHTHHTHTHTLHIYTHHIHMHSPHTHTTPHTHTHHTHAFTTHTHTTPHTHIHTLTTHNMHSHTHDTLGNEAIVGIPQGVIKQKERAPMKGHKNSGEEEHGTIGDVKTYTFQEPPETREENCVPQHLCDKMRVNLS